MKAEINMERPNLTPSFWRRFTPVWLAGAFGVVVLALQPIPPAVTNIPELASLPPLAQRAALIANPLVLLTLAAVAGAALAPRVGLRSWLAGLPPARLTIGTALWIGFLLAVAMALLDALLAPIIGGSWADLVDQAPAPSLLLGLFYGAITEEIMLRWGGLGVTLYFCMRLAKCMDRTALRVQQAGWAAVVLMSAVFAAGHLPALGAAIDLDAPVLIRTFLFNFLAGIGYGYLSWRHSLESAMIAHASTHAGLAAMGWVLF